MRQAFRRYAAVADAIELAERDEARFFELLVERVEPALAARTRPVFLCDYPASQAALARLSPNDPRVAERFELYRRRRRALQRLRRAHRPGEQQRRHRVERDGAAPRETANLPARSAADRRARGRHAARGRQRARGRSAGDAGGRSRVDRRRPGVSGAAYAERAGAQVYRTIEITGVGSSRSRPLSDSSSITNA